MRKALAAAALVSLVLVGGAQAGVTVYGPSSAMRVLVLVPGYGGGGGTFAQVGPVLVEHVPNLQVWTVDRRGVALEDRTGFATGDPAAAYGYYLGQQQVSGRRFDANLPPKLPRAKSWGLAATLGDLRRIVLRARAGGKRKVILGGHSFGAATAATYAAWDFGGHPGYRDLSGLVFVDGGELGTFGTPTASKVKADLAQLAANANPFEDQLRAGVPWLFGVFAQLAALSAQVAPDAPSTLAQSPLVPPALRPPGNPTNAQFFAFAATADGFDTNRCGLGNVASLIAGPDAVEWYFPTRLRIDLLGASSLGPDPVTRLLGLRLTHLHEIDVPVYAFATSGYPGSLTAARTLIAQSRAPRASSRLAQDPAMKHSDPLCTPYPKSRFLQTLVGWLRR